MLDAFPAMPPKSKTARKAASQAADYIGATINAAGYLCARPVEAQKVATGQYGVGCKTHRSEGGSVNFIVDVRTGSVSEI